MVMTDEMIDKLFAAAVAAGFAELLTTPIDQAKVRLQVQSSAAPGVKGRPAPPQYSGTFDCMAQIARSEGFFALWTGVIPSLLRQVSYTSLAMVLYDPLRDWLSGDADPTYLNRLICGGVAGALSIALLNPTEVLKTRMQTSRRGGAKAAESGGSKPETMTMVVASVWSDSGLLGFWAGMTPNIVRTFIVNAAELGTYDQVTILTPERPQPLGCPRPRPRPHPLTLALGPALALGFALALGVALSPTSTLTLFLLIHNQVKTLLVLHLALNEDSGACSVLSSAIAGTVSAFASTPVDVIKTRFMASSRTGQSGGVLGAGRKIVAKEGWGALYKGVGAVIVRKVVWCSIYFYCYEQITHSP